METDRKNIINVVIRGDRSVSSGDNICLEFKEIDSKVSLSDNSTDDIKALFDKVFDFAINSDNQVSFVLEDEGADLFHDVANDVVNQLNMEISQSRDDINRIRGLIQKSKEV